MKVGKRLIFSEILKEAEEDINPSQQNTDDSSITTNAPSSATIKPKAPTKKSRGRKKSGNATDKEKEKKQDPRRERRTNLEQGKDFDYTVDNADKKVIDIQQYDKEGKAKSEEDLSLELNKEYSQNLESIDTDDSATKGYHIDTNHMYKKLSSKSNLNADSSNSGSTSSIELSKGLLQLNPSLLVGDEIYRDASTLKGKILKSLDDIKNSLGNDVSVYSLSVDALKNFVNDVSTDNPSANQTSEAVSESEDYSNNDEIDDASTEDNIDNASLDASTDDSETEGEKNDKEDASNKTKIVDISSVAKEQKVKIDFDDSVSDADKTKITKAIAMMCGADPAEVLAPLAIVTNNAAFRSDATARGINTFLRTNDTSMSCANISFPAARNYPLADSIIAFANNVTKADETRSFSVLKVSSKGGLDGKGATASLTSLLEPIISDNLLLSSIALKQKSYLGTAAVEKIIDKNYSKAALEKFKSISNDGSSNNSDISIGLKIIVGIGLNGHDDQTRYLIELYNSIIDSSQESKEKTKHLEYIKGKSPNPEQARILLDFMNDEKYKVSRICQNCLTMLSYSFCQVNSKPKYGIDKGDDFYSIKYTHTIQYPAVFDGDIKIERLGNGFGFHIY